MRSIACCVSLVFLLSSGFAFAQHDTATAEYVTAEYVIEPAEFPRQEMLFKISLPVELQGQFPLAIASTAIPYARIQRDGDQTAIVYCPDDLAAGVAFTLRVTQSKDQCESEERASHETAEMFVEEDEHSVSLKNADRVVLQYHKSVVEPPSGVAQFYRRSGHIHPVYTPAGQVVTDEFPVDHRHQHALFAAWVNTSFQGRKVDFWNQHHRTGTVEHRRVISTVSGPVFAEFVVELAYVDLTDVSQPVDALREVWTVKAFSCQDGNLFEIHSVQSCATRDPVTLHAYHYGGLAIRGAAEWTHDSDFAFLTRKGDGRASGNHVPTDWVNLSGSIGDSRASITMFSSPLNERSPQPVRLHPEFPYAVFTPVVERERTITAESPIRSRYQFFVQDGEVDQARIEQVWQNFITPVVLAR